MTFRWLEPSTSRWRHWQTLCSISHSGRRLRIAGQREAEPTTISWDSQHITGTTENRPAKWIVAAAGQSVNQSGPRCLVKFSTLRRKKLIRSLQIKTPHMRVCAKLLDILLLICCQILAIISHNHWVHVMIVVSNKCGQRSVCKVIKGCKNNR